MRSRCLKLLFVPSVVLVALAIANPARADHRHNYPGGYAPRGGIGFSFSIGQGYPAAYRAYDLRAFHSYPSFRSYYYPSYYPSYPLYPSYPAVGYPGYGAYVSPGYYGGDYGGGYGGYCW
jgi:hypothetical protein